MVIAYKSSSLSFAGLLAFILIGCGDGSVPLYSDTDELARGTATIALSIGQRLCVDIGRVEIIATAQNLNEHFPDELLYTGSGQTDMLLDQQVRLEVVMQPVREVVKLLPLAFIGAGDFASERFLLKARVPYAVHIEYREAITVDLIDSINGDRVEHLLQVTGDERERVSLSRTFNLHNTKEVFLHIRDTSKAWYIEIHEGE
ncbi:MAG: hypothetical protein HOL51_15205 [Gemmatimonadetes bacterium]|jgi:hypothetical protein|nr:hypothetical protein [Gemmatimonadota bacterium]MBT5327461.1 hypothetical protein [Gemmatimonadota bacterium]MBT5448862.1 hypothetical protein [Gemmatimonadota bacterium]MBT5800812.1 hypothetical protein [Gemmatimonadota bacterium]MBT6623432.1 hypothetical protein [Gemmatimonadota bacterium]